MFGQIFLVVSFWSSFFIDVVISVLRKLETRKVSGATFGFVRTMLGAAFHLFILSRQTPMYESDEIKNFGNLRMQNERINETLAAPMYEQNQNQLYLHAHSVNNPMLISSNLSELLGNDPNVIYPLGNVPPNSNIKTHRNAPSTSSTFLMNSNNGNASNTSNNGKAPKNVGKATLPRP